MHGIHLQCTQVYKRVKDHICPLGSCTLSRHFSVAVQERLACCEPKLQENKDVLSYFSARVRFKQHSNTEINTVTCSNLY